MSYKPETPFDSIESAHEYVGLLSETVQEVLHEVEAEMALPISENTQRRKEALQLICYQLTKLSGHMTSSRRILNDLRSLRRLFYAERNAASHTDEPKSLSQKAGG